MTSKIERTWITKSGLTAKVVMNNFDYPHRCGYVSVPESYENYGRDYNDVEGTIDVHGGLTYADKQSTGYWFGFDAMHYGDLPDWEVGEAMCETDEEFKQMEVIKNIGLGFSVGEVRDLDYMVQECESLAEQLEFIEMNGE